MTTDYKQIKSLLNKEIEGYKYLENLVEKKRESLVRNDVDTLRNVDVKIVKCNAVVEKIERERLNMLGNNKDSLSKIIANIENNEQKNDLNRKKEELKKTVLNIQLQNNINKKLLNHSLTMVENSINVISKLFTPESSAYDKSGAANKKDHNMLSSIVEEA